MVWFQCEDCGENLKKPKLPNHFRICSAFKLSCIDCGEMFGQQSVQGHTQCITEAEKYGPKGIGKAPNGMAAKPKIEAKQKPDVDVNVGLSERPPWFCSLCNTKATSKQALLIHAEGKKHKAKARAFHAANKQPEQAEKSTTSAMASPESNQNDELPGNINIEQPKEKNPPKVPSTHNSSKAETGSLLSSKKRKHEEPENDSSRDVVGGGVSGELGNGEVIQIEKADKQESKHQNKKAKHGTTEKVVEGSSTEQDAKKKIKWKKLIISALKSNPDNVLKIRKLRKLVVGSLGETGFAEDEGQLTDILEQKINSSSKFTVDGKYVRLVAKS